MIIPIFSIVIITTIFYLANKKLHFEICPICTGVFLTWFWMLIGMYLGKLSILQYQLPTAILLGGSVIGLMSKLEPFIKIKFILIWKTIFIIFGFISVYNLLYSNWKIFSIGIFLSILSIFVFKIYKIKEKTEKIKEFENKMKNCC